MKKTLFIISAFSIGSLLAMGNLPTGTVNPVAGTQAQVGYQAGLGTNAQIGYQAQPEIGYQAPTGGSEAQVGYQGDIGTRAEAMQLPKAEL